MFIPGVLLFSCGSELILVFVMWLQLSLVPLLSKLEQVCFTGVTTLNYFSVAMTTVFFGNRPAEHRVALWVQNILGSTIIRKMYSGHVCTYTPIHRHCAVYIYMYSS